MSLDTLSTYFDLSYDSPDPEQEMIDEEVSGTVREAVAQLSPVEQAAIALHYFEGLWIRETALALRRSVIETQTILARARRKLFRILMPQLVHGETARRDGSRRRTRAA